MSEQEMKQKKAGRGSLAPVRPRRDYKDTLFRMLFNDREALLSLYNAVGNTDYRDPSLLQIVTLENAVYMNVKNDLAFLLGFELNSMSISPPGIRTCLFGICSMLPESMRC